MSTPETPDDFVARIATADLTPSEKWRLICLARFCGRNLNTPTLVSTLHAFSPEHGRTWYGFLSSMKRRGLVSVRRNTHDKVVGHSIDWNRLRGSSDE